MRFTSNVNAVMRFIDASGGVILRSFDPLLDNSEEALYRLPEEKGISFPGESGELHPMPGAFLLAERLTGIRLRAADIADADERMAVGIRP